MNQQRKPTICQFLRRAMDADRWVCRIRYRAKNNELTERVISPTRIKGGIVQALCLCREQNRQFEIDRILQINLVPASEAIMPETIKVIAENGPDVSGVLLEGKVK